MFQGLSPHPRVFYFIPEEGDFLCATLCSFALLSLLELVAAQELREGRPTTSRNCLPCLGTDLTREAALGSQGLPLPTSSQESTSLSLRRSGDKSYPDSEERAQQAQS